MCSFTPWRLLPGNHDVSCASPSSNLGLDTSTRPGGNLPRMRHLPNDIQVGSSLAVSATSLLSSIEASLGRKAYLRHKQCVPLVLDILRLGSNTALNSSDFRSHAMSIRQLYQWLIRRRRERRYHDPDETEKPVSVSDASEEGSDTSGSSTRSKSPLSLPRPPRNVPVLPISENMAASTSLKRKALIQSKKPQPQTSDQHQSTTATNSAEHPVLPKDNASSDHVDAAGNPADPPQQPRRGTTGLKDFLGRSVRFTTSTKGSWG
ncbi:hypothetical protein ANO11243_041130 [Dothideomycetidae sp. 11243]|nr:hypothetical protein ANO11243_041130 [fungal sp. No.11243]